MLVTPTARSDEGHARAASGRSMERVPDLRRRGWQSPWKAVGRQGTPGWIREAGCRSDPPGTAFRLAAEPFHVARPRQQQGWNATTGPRASWIPAGPVPGTAANLRETAGFVPVFRPTSGLRIGNRLVLTH